MGPTQLERPRPQGAATSMRSFARPRNTGRAPQTGDSSAGADARTARRARRWRAAPPGAGSRLDANGTSVQPRSLAGQRVTEARRGPRAADHGGDRHGSPFVGARRTRASPRPPCESRLVARESKNATRPASVCRAYVQRVNDGARRAYCREDATELVLVGVAKATKIRSRR